MQEYQFTVIKHHVPVSTTQTGIMRAVFFSHICINYIHHMSELFKGSDHMLRTAINNVM